MKKSYKKVMVGVLAGVMVLGGVGCQEKQQDTATTEVKTETKTEAKVEKKIETKDITLAINMPMTDVMFKTLSEIGETYEKANEGINVEVVTYPDYETAMRTKMAANDLPDLWATHGWSLMRYSEYLTPLQDREWASKVDSSIKDVISDKDGSFYALPMDYEVAGIAFNKEVLELAGVDYTSIKTWDDFKVACGKIKEAGKIPLYIGGSKDDWTIGNFFDWIAPSFLITNDTENDRTALQDGSFDWNKWKPAAQLLLDLQEAGYINKNVNEGTWPEVGEQLAKGNAAFAFFGNYVISEAKNFNPDGDYGFMPIPAATDNDQPTFIAGERVAIGVWKDAPNKNETLDFIDYLAQSENINAVAKASSNPTGLCGDGYKADLGALQPYFEATKDYRSFGYFDREYLPSGMWNSLCQTGSGLLSGGMNLDDVSEKMENDYKKLNQN